LRFKIPFIAEIKDVYSRDNFKIIREFLANHPFSKGEFKFYDLDLSAVSYPSMISVKHGLSFIPKDVIQSYLTGGTIIWNYGYFTKDNIYVTISGPCKVRFFLGRYEE